MAYLSKKRVAELMEWHVHMGFDATTFDPVTRKFTLACTKCEVERKGPYHWHRFFCPNEHAGRCNCLKPVEDIPKDQWPGGRMKMVPRETA